MAPVKYVKLTLYIYFLNHFNFPKDLPQNEQETF